VVTVFLWDGARVLLARRSAEVSTYPGCWAGVSGYVEQETPRERALIEVEEECGLDRADLEVLGEGTPMLVRDERLARSFRVHPFLVRVDHPERVRPDWEAEGFAWVPVAELAGGRRTPAVPQLSEAFAAAWRAAGFAADPSMTPETPTAWVNALRRPSAYPERPRRVEMVETHISWVFLTDRYVYKLKKPVRFEFLDYATREARQRACVRELELNRRLAPGVYLGLVPAAVDRRGRVRLGRDDGASEWLVRMRRLPQERMLDELIRRGALRADELARLAARLARFYAEAPPLPLRAEEYRRRVEQHVRANRAELLAAECGLPASQVRRVHAAQLKLLELTPAVFERRVCDGRIVDGHGDLRPEHVCLEDPPVVFDCIEFNDELRQVDVADELSFLDVECRRLGAPHIGRELLAAYAAASGDLPPSALLDFYASYRACVRAKVAALRAAQHQHDDRQRAGDEARGYLELADAAAGTLRRPFVLVTGGLMGTGKSTLARSLAERLGAELLQTDAVRREVLGGSAQRAAFGGDNYAADKVECVYNELFRRAADLLAEGVSVVLDGSFLSAAHRQRAAGLARQSGAAWLLLRCVCPRELARERVAERLRVGHDASEARVDLMDEQARREEADPTGLACVEIDTTLAQAEQQERALAALAGALDLEGLLSSPAGPGAADAYLRQPSLVR
jgi:aminoglycoside phosphotransferase family enzyme/predicted kinase/ADP-ribose pyrophosphatase YjhB (NUDIX family)